MPSNLSRVVAILTTIMAEKSTIDAANASHNEKDINEAPPDYEVERNGSTARRKSVALNIVENPLKVIQASISFESGILTRLIARFPRAKHS